jgi:kynurenine formamidase
MPGTNWGRWGENDERGALNVLTQDMIRAAAGAVTEGRFYSLGIPIQATGVPLMDYRGTPMRLTLQDGTDAGIHADFGEREGTGSHEDVLVMASHTTSHMDALVHVYADWEHYNGVKHHEMHALTGAGRLGIEKVGGFAARAVLLDMVAHFEADTMVPDGRIFTGADLEACAERQGVEVRAGDVVLIRTGYLDWFFAQKSSNPPFVSQAGIGTDASEWLAAKDVVAVGSDNAAVEAIPFDGNDFLAAHKVLLVRYGVYLLEFLNLADLARDGAYEGLIAVGPLKVTGATGSPINPIFVA